MRGDIVDLVAILRSDVTVESVNSAMKTAAEGPMKGILSYSEDPLVSSDVIGSPYSSIFDSLATMVLDGGTSSTLGGVDYNEEMFASMAEVAGEFGTPIRPS